MRTSKILFFIFFIATGLFLSSWGDLGHAKISKQSTLSFKCKFRKFGVFSEFIVAHASDPDYRKSSDKTEGPKHYIDIDNYDEFLKSGKIAVLLEDNIKLHGEDFVKNNGYLPWATIAAYDSLVSCLKRADYVNAAVFAADLGHYVADGFMPLHTTKNYDGQLTDNKGIHGRYESDMVNKYIDSIDYKIKKPNKIENIENYIFEYIYESNKYCQTIIDADNYAQKTANSTESEDYLTALWSKTKEMTVELFRNSSQALADLYYTAWLEAGKPLKMSF